MNLKSKIARYFFQKRDSALSLERIRQEQRNRLNPLRGFDPDRLVAAIDAFRVGSLGDLARIIEELELRDDDMSIGARKSRASIGRCPHQVLLVEGYEDDPRARAHRDILTRFWANVEVTSAFARNERGNVRLLKKQMAAAISHCYQVHEIVWLPRPDGSISARFINIPLWFFENRTGELRFLPRPGMLEGEAMPAGEWLVTVGDGVGIAASVLAMSKTLSRNDWLLFSERCGQPGLHAKTDAAEGSPAWQAIVGAVANFGREWAIVTDNSTSVDPISLNTGGPLPYPQLIEVCNKGIAALYRGADLSTLSHSDSVGASVQEGETDLLEADTCEMISETLNSQVERFVIRYTTGDDTPLAYLSIAPTAKPDIDQEIKIDTHLASLGVKLSKLDALQRYGRAEYDPANQADSPLEPQKPASHDMPWGMPNATPLQNAKTPLQNEDREKDGSTYGSTPKTPQNADLAALAAAITADYQPIAQRIAQLLESPEAQQPSLAAALLEDLPSLLPEDPQTAAMLEELLAARFTAALTAITNANPNQPRGNPTNSGQFAKTPGGSRPREPETKGTKDRLG